MIDFMVLGLPRSGTAWLANLLTTDDSICLHEALIDSTIEQLDKFEHSGLFGIAETAGVFLPDVISYPCKKLIVDRPIDDIKRSLHQIGLPTMPDVEVDLLSGIEGYKIAFKDLFNFDAMQLAYKFLLNKDLSKDRHILLRQMNVQNQYAISAVKRMF